MNEADATDLVPDRWRIHAVLLVTVAMTLTGISIVNVALPSMQSGLGASNSDLQWVLASYALTFGIALIPAGRAGDVMGRGGVYLVGVTIFLLASVVAGFSTDITTLNLARFAQGLGSGILSPQIVGILQQNFRGAERGRAFGAYGTVVALSMGIAPLLGGTILAIAGSGEGWRWTLFINVPVSLIAIALAFTWFPRPLFHRRESSERLDLDPVGVVLLGVGILLVLLPFLTPPDSPLLWLLCPAGVGVLVAWAGWEKRYRNNGRKPIVDVAIFASSGFRSGVTLAAVYFFGITAVWVLVALYLLLGLGYSAFEAGLMGLPSAICGAVSARWAGKRVLEYGRRIVTVGISIAMCGLALSVLVVHLHASGYISIWWLLLTLAPMGIGQGTVISPNQTLTLSNAPLEYAGSTGGILQTGQRIGSAVGLAVVTAIAFTVASISSWADAIVAAFATIIIALGLAFAISVRDERTRRAHGADYF